MKVGEVVLSVILALTLFAAPFPADAQQPGKVYRLGFLGGPAQRLMIQAPNSAR